MQDRAIAGELVVLVEDVDHELAVLTPVIHRLPGDQRHAAVDGRLRHLAVLHAVRPAPDDLARAQCPKVLGQRLGEQEHVALGEELLARAQPRDQRPQLRVGEPEPIAVAVLEEHARAQVGIDALEVRGMDRLPALVGLAGRRDDTEGQLVHRDESMGGSSRLAGRECRLSEPQAQQLDARARDERLRARGAASASTAACPLLSNHRRRPARRAHRTSPAPPPRTRSAGRPR